MQFVHFTDATADELGIIADSGLRTPGAGGFAVLRWRRKHLELSTCFGLPRVDHDPKIMSFIFVGRERPGERHVDALVTTFDASVACQRVR